MHYALIQSGFLSGWQDLNLRPPRPERGTLPNWATSRYEVNRRRRLTSGDGSYFTPRNFSCQVQTVPITCFFVLLQNHSDWQSFLPTLVKWTSVCFVQRDLNFRSSRIGQFIHLFILISTRQKYCPVCAEIRHSGGLIFFSLGKAALDFWATRIIHTQGEKNPEQRTVKEKT